MADPVSSAYEFGLKLLQDLISIPTVSPAGENYWDAAKLLSDTLESLGFKTRIVEVDRDYQREQCKTASSKPRYIVLARMGEDDRPVLHFNGHYDVVPGGPGWTVTEPFKPVIKDGKLYGRGAIDMKGGIAAAIAGVKAALDQGYKPTAIAVEMAFVPDEEIGGECGTGYLVEKLLVRAPEYVMIPEPSGLHAPWHGHKGALWAKVKVRGRTAHASTPWRGVNAFLLGSRLALLLGDLYAPLLASRTTKYKITPPDAKYSTVMIGGVAGVEGGKTNQVPGLFYFTVDRRLIPGETVASALDELEGLLKWASVQLGGVDYEVEVLQEMEPVVADPGELYDALKKAARSAGVELGEPELCPGGLDMRYYIVKGSKALSYGPSGHTAHAPDEHISLEEFRKLVEIFASLPRELEAVVSR